MRYISERAVNSLNEFNKRELRRIIRFVENSSKERVYTSSGINVKISDEIKTKTYWPYGRNEYGWISRYMDKANANLDPIEAKHVTDIIESLSYSIRSSESVKSYADEWMKSADRDHREEYWMDVFRDNPIPEIGGLNDFSPEAKKLLAKFARDLADEPITTLVLGSYNDETKTITMYFNAIAFVTRTRYLNDKEFLKKYSNVLAHEFFHAIEHAYCNEENFRDEENGWVVPETFSEPYADYFSYLWSKSQRDVTIANNLINDWMRYYYTVLPRAKALEFVIKYTGKEFGEFEINTRICNPGKFWDEFLRNISFFSKSSVKPFM